MGGGGRPRFASPHFSAAPPGLWDLFGACDPALACWAKFFGSPPGLGLPNSSGIGGGTRWKAEDRQKWLSHISPPPLWGSGIYLRVVTQHLRAGLNSSAALRAFDAQLFGHWTRHRLGGGVQPEMAVPHFLRRPSGALGFICGLRPSTCVLG